MFKADLDRLHHQEQVQDYLREGEQRGVIQVRRQVKIAGFATVACFTFAGFAYWIGTLLATAR